MHLKNITARVITINTPKPNKASYRIIPGETVEVPEKDLGVSKQFVDSWIESGALLEVVAPKAAKAEQKTEAKKAD